MPLSAPADPSPSVGLPRAAALSASASGASGAAADAPPPPFAGRRRAVSLAEASVPRLALWGTSTDAPPLKRASVAAACAACLTDASPALSATTLLLPGGLPPALGLGGAHSASVCATCRSRGLTLDSPSMMHEADTGFGEEEEDLAGSLPAAFCAHLRLAPRQPMLQGHTCASGSCPHGAPSSIDSPSRRPALTGSSAEEASDGQSAGGGGSGGGGSGGEGGSGGGGDGAARRPRPLSFMDEFMSCRESWSLSWRESADRQPSIRYGRGGMLGGAATSGSGGSGRSLLAASRNASGRSLGGSASSELPSSPAAGEERPRILQGPPSRSASWRSDASALLRSPSSSREAMAAAAAGYASALPSPLPSAISPAPAAAAYMWELRAARSSESGGSGGRGPGEGSAEGRELEAGFRARGGAGGGAATDLVGSLPTAVGRPRVLTT